MIQLAWWQLALIIAASGSFSMLVFAAVVGGAIADENISRAAGQKEDADV